MAWKTTALEISKLAGTVGVDAVLHTVHVPGINSPFGTVINEIFVAFLSATILILLTNGIIQRPRLLIEWRRKAAPEIGPAIRYAPDDVDYEEFFSISCTLEGASLLARWLRRRGHYDGLFLDIRYAPADALLLKPDLRRSARLGVVANGGVQLRMNELPSGGSSWATFTLKLGAGPPDQLQKVTVLYAFVRPNGSNKWFDKHALKMEIGVHEVHAILGS